MTTFYQKISVEKELPSHHAFKKYHTAYGFATFRQSGQWISEETMDYITPTYWLKEVSVEEWMVEFAEWTAKNWKPLTTGENTTWVYSYNDKKAVKHTTNDLLIEFMNFKNYIQK